MISCTFARTAEAYRPYYDFVLNNVEGRLEDAADELKRYILEQVRRSR